MTDEEVQVVAIMMTLDYMQKEGCIVTKEQAGKIVNVISSVAPAAYKVDEDHVFVDRLISILEDYANKEKKQPNNVSKLTLHVDLSDDTKHFFSKIEEYLEIDKQMQKYEAEQKETA